MAEISSEPNSSELGRGYVVIRGKLSTTIIHKDRWCGSVFVSDYQSGGGLGWWWDDFIDIIKQIAEENGNGKI